VKKCRWFHDAAAAAVLMIDDLSNGYLDLERTGLVPASDWGLGGRGPDSIFRYFEDGLLSKHPEIRYTVFLPFGRHSIGLVESSYPAVARGAFETDEFVGLLRHILAQQQEIAYHGHHHGSPHPTLDPQTWVGEHEHLGHSVYAEQMAADLCRFKDVFGVDLLGGKSPGYRYDDSLETLLQRSPFRWWAFDYAPARRLPEYRGRLIDFPANLVGNALSARGDPIRRRVRRFLAEYRIETIIAHGGVVAIQEHFLSTRPDGRRQHPNLYDDLPSLEKIFDLLRGEDIWYATCSDIAWYYDSVERTRIVPGRAGENQLIYDGAWEKPLLSVTVASPQLTNVATGAVIHGVRKGGHWIFSGLAPGTYREA
jgi:hypothetical protein